MADGTRTALLVNMGAVQLEEDDDDSEVSVARMPRNTVADWKKAQAGGGDLRLLGTFRNASGK
eukprot:5942364-Heterocapsa_arctica.AAC.1